MSRLEEIEARRQWCEEWLARGVLRPQITPEWIHLLEDVAWLIAQVQAERGAEAVSAGESYADLVRLVQAASERERKLADALRQIAFPDGAATLPAGWTLKDPRQVALDALIDYEQKQHPYSWTGHEMPGDK